jgi:hypothetical protein
MKVKKLIKLLKGLDPDMKIKMAVIDDNIITSIKDVVEVISPHTYLILPKTTFKAKTKKTSIDLEKPSVENDGPQ